MCDNFGRLEKELKPTTIKFQDLPAGIADMSHFELTIPEIDLREMHATPTGRTKVEEVPIDPNLQNFLKNWLASVQGTPPVYSDPVEVSYLFTKRGCCVVFVYPDAPINWEVQCRSKRHAKQYARQHLAQFPRCYMKNVDVDHNPINQTADVRFEIVWEERDAK